MADLLPDGANLGRYHLLNALVSLEIALTDAGLWGLLQQEDLAEASEFIQGLRDKLAQSQATGGSSE